MRSLACAAALALLPSFAGAQSPLSLPPGVGTPVDFVACPERTAGGSWVATDAVSGYTYSLAGTHPEPNVVIRVTGVVSPDFSPVPGWQLAPVKIIVGRQVCRSAGVLQPIPAGGLFPYLPAAPLPVVSRY